MNAQHINMSSVPLDYPACAALDAFENKLAADLPVVPGLGLDMSQSERLSVYSSVVAEQHTHFVARNGDEFGLERREVERKDAMCSAFGSVNLTAFAGA